MASTIPFPFKNYTSTNPSNALLTSKITHVIDSYEHELRNCDKASDPEDGSFYQGKVEALEEALTELLDVPQAAWHTYRHTQ